jgi:hypothetical protein
VTVKMVMQSRKQFLQPMTLDASANREHDRVRDRIAGEDPGSVKAVLGFHCSLLPASAAIQFLHLWNEPGSFSIVAAIRLNRLSIAVSITATGVLLQRQIVSEYVLYVKRGQLESCGNTAFRETEITSLEVVIGLIALPRPLKHYFSVASVFETVPVAIWTKNLALPLCFAIFV